MNPCPLTSFDEVAELNMSAEGGKGGKALHLGSHPIYSARDNYIKPSCASIIFFSLIKFLRKEFLVCSPCPPPPPKWFLSVHGTDVESRTDQKTCCPDSILKMWRQVVEGNCHCTSTRSSDLWCSAMQKNQSSSQNWQASHLLNDMFTVYLNN